MTMLHVYVGFGYRYHSTKTLDFFDVRMSPNHLRNREVEIAEAPHHALIMYNDLYCSGSLITSRVVVTAAMCFWKYRGGAVVKVGAESITGFGQVIPVVEVIIHEYFKHLSSLDNDIAIVVLKDDVGFRDSVAKVLLIEPDVALYDGSPLYVTGYGGNDSSANNYDSSLVMTEIILVNKLKCQHVLGPIMTNSNFCAKYKMVHKQNENGGGVLYENLLVGILSHEVEIQEEEIIYAVLTNVSYFNRWLKLNTIRVLKKYCSRKKYDSHLVESNEYE